MPSRAFFIIGLWPSLAIPLAVHLGRLSPWAAALIALVCVGLYLGAALKAGRGRAADFGLAVFMVIYALGGLIGGPIGRLITIDYFFFALYSALFFSLSIPVWLSLDPTQRQAEGDERYPIQEKTGRRQRAAMAVIFLASALVSLKAGLMYKVIIPVLLLAVGGLAVGRLVRPRVNRRRPETGDKPGRGAGEPTAPLADDDSGAAAGRLGPVGQALIIQSSPRGPDGVTELMLIPFLAGLKAEGVETRTVHLATADLKPCDGDFTCWVKTPGKCKHQDDMAGLINALTEADLVILAGPVKFGAFPELMHRFLDRCLPMWEPWAVAHPAGGTYRPPRAGRLFGRRLMLLAVGSLPDQVEFGPVNSLIDRLAHYSDAPVAARLTRPAADLLLLGHWLGSASEKVQRALYEAGREMARQGSVNSGTAAQISGPMFSDPAAYRLVANILWETWQDYHAARRAGVKLPDLATFLARDVRLGLATMVLTFDQPQAGGEEVTYQFNLSGRQPGQWYLKIKTGRCTFHEGWSAYNDLIIHAPSELWVDLARGKLAASQAVVDGLIKLEGRSDMIDDIPRYFGWDKHRQELLQSIKRAAEII